jgi:hypothetical protein
VVAVEPYLKKIGEAPVLRDVFDREVAVIVKNRLRRGVMMIQSLRDVVGKQEVFVEKSLHSRVFQAMNISVPLRAEHRRRVSKSSGSIELAIPHIDS